MPSSIPRRAVVVQAVSVLFNEIPIISFSVKLLLKQKQVAVDQELQEEQVATCDLHILLQVIDSCGPIVYGVPDHFFFFFFRERSGIFVPRSWCSLH